VGYFDQGKLHYASKVGAAFTDHETREFLEGMAVIQLSECPSEAIPASAGTSWSYGLTAAELKTAVLAQAYPRVRGPLHRVDEGRTPAPSDL
jgi:hypothetical protein